MNKDELFDMFINEIAGNKEVNIEDFVYNVALNYDITDPSFENKKCIVDDSLPSIHINNVELFKQKLEEYIQVVSSKKDVIKDMPFEDERDRTKYLAAMLFVNATAEDFGWPYSYMDKYIAATKDDTFADLKEEKSICKLKTFKDAELTVMSKNQSIFLETPQRLQYSLSKVMQDGKEYTVDLPSVSCFCYDDGKDKVLNIAAIQNKRIDNDKERDVFEKQVNRQKFKLNAGVDKEEQDVEPLAILSLATTICLAKERGVTKVKMPDFMPMRWYAKELANEKKSRSRNLNLEELREEQIRIQTNITDKFLRNMMRINEQLGLVDVTNLPVIMGDYLECKITDKQVDNPNEILKEIADNISPVKKKEDSMER